MCALAHTLEHEGIATTGIALVRENAEALRPPRLLWVSFPLGRPLGAPGDAAFQRRVMRAALDLLERERGPVLEDFPDDAPGDGADAVFVCPVRFPVAPRHAHDSFAARLEAEVRSLEPWYALSRRRRGRTTVGVSGTPIADIAARVARLGDADGTEEDLAWLKRGLDDLRAYYEEALTAQPGSHPAHGIDRVLWHETIFGALIKTVHRRFSAEPRTRLFARILAPRVAVESGTGSDPVTARAGTPDKGADDD